jgi:hypothetical protein
VSRPSPRPGLGLHPGSEPPRDEEELEWLLGHVPDVAMAGELDRCLFAGERLKEVAGLHAHEQVRRLADQAFVERLRAALTDLGARAERDENGGMRVVVAAFAHFLGKELPIDEHPLVAAIYVRSLAEAHGTGSTPAQIAFALDRYAALPKVDQG